MDIDPLHLVQTFSDAGEIHKNSALSKYLDTKFTPNIVDLI